MQPTNVAGGAVSLGLKTAPLRNTTSGSLSSRTALRIATPVLLRGSVASAQCTCNVGTSCAVERASPHSPACSGFMPSDAITEAAVINQISPSQALAARAATASSS